MNNELKIKLKLKLLRETGSVSISNLARQWRLNRTMIYHALAGNGVRSVRVKIAKALKQKPSEIWPDRSAEVMRQDDDLYEGVEVEPEPPKIDSPWFTPDEAAAYLKLNKKTLQNYMSRGLIPYTKTVTGTVRLNRKALDSWLMSSRKVGNWHGI